MTPILLPCRVGTVRKVDREAIIRQHLAPVVQAARDALASSPNPLKAEEAAAQAARAVEYKGQPVSVKFWRVSGRLTIRLAGVEEVIQAEAPV